MSCSPPSSTSDHRCTSADSLHPGLVWKKKIHPQPSKHQQLNVGRAAAAGRTPGWGELRVWPSSPACGPPRTVASPSASGSQLQRRKSVTRRRCSGPELRRPVWTNRGRDIKSSRKPKPSLWQVTVKRGLNLLPPRWLSEHNSLWDSTRLQIRRWVILKWALNEKET